MLHEKEATKYGRHLPMSSPYFVAFLFYASSLARITLRYRSRLCLLYHLVKDRMIDQRAEITGQRQPEKKCQRCKMNIMGEYKRNHRHYDDHTDRAKQFCNAQYKGILETRAYSVHKLCREREHPHSYHRKEQHADIDKDADNPAAFHSGKNAVLIIQGSGCKKHNQPYRSRTFNVDPELPEERTDNMTFLVIYHLKQNVVHGSDSSPRCYDRNTAY